MHDQAVWVGTARLWPHAMHGSVLHEGWIRWCVCRIPADSVTGHEKIERRVSNGVVLLPTACVGHMEVRIALDSPQWRRAPANSVHRPCGKLYQIGLDPHTTEPGQPVESAPQHKLKLSTLERNLGETRLHIVGACREACPGQQTSTHIAAHAQVCGLPLHLPKPCTCPSQLLVTKHATKIPDTTECNHVPTGRGLTPPNARPLQPAVPPYRCKLMR